MGLVVTRGAIQGELAGQVAMESVVAMLIFMGVGAIAGWIADTLVRDSIEMRFRARVDWYRQGMIDAGYVQPGPTGGQQTGSPVGQQADS